MSGRAELPGVWATDGGGAAHRQVPATQDHRQGQLRQGQARQAYPHRQGGRHQDHRQNTGEIEHLEKNQQSLHSS